VSITVADLHDATLVTSAAQSKHDALSVANQ